MTLIMSYLRPFMSQETPVLTMQLLTLQQETFFLLVVLFASSKIF